MPGKILLLTSNFPRWQGDSTTPFVLHFAQDLQALGWQVDVLAPHAPGAAKCEELDGVRVRRFQYFWPQSAQTVCYDGGALINLRRRPYEKLKLPVLVAAEWASLVQELRSGGYDLVNPHWILPQGFVAALARPFFGLPTAITVHGGEVFGLKGGAMSAFMRFAMRRAQAVTVNSSATEAAVRSIDPDGKHIHRAPMGIDAAPPDTHAVAAIRAEHVTDGQYLALFLGRVIVEKGIEETIDAVRLLRDQGRNVKLLVVGEGQERARAEALRTELGLEQTVKFLGWVRPEDVKNYMAAADVFVGPSWTEPQGLTFREALAAGTAVVASAVGGIVDAIIHEETGLLVEPKSPEQVADAVARLMDDPELGERLASAGKELVYRDLTRPAVAQRFSSLFESLIQ